MCCVFQSAPLYRGTTSFLRREQEIPEHHGFPHYQWDYCGLTEAGEKVGTQREVENSRAQKKRASLFPKYNECNLV